MLSNDSHYMTLKDLPPETRPRERMRQKGPGALSDSELLALLIASGTQKATALELAVILLSEHGGLRGMAGTNLDRLSSCSGIGPAKACKIMAAIEIAKRLSMLGKEEKIKINSPADASKLLLGNMRFLDKEHFMAILLDTKNGVIATEEISVGCLDGSLVHPRELFKVAIQKSAAGIIIAHNHPSGDPAPSKDDIKTTERLQEAAGIIGISLLDHLIIGDGCFVSLKEKGVIV